MCDYCYVWSVPHGRLARGPLVLFLTGVRHGALSVCKHFCLDVCWGAERVIIDSSQACADVIAFAWQAGV